MNKAVWLGAAGLAVAVGMLAVGYLAGRPEAAIENDAPQMVAVASAESTVNRSEIENIVRDYVLKNPELLIDMQQALETKQREQQRVANLEVIEAAKEDIFNAAYDGFVGNPAGKTTIVEFYDYNCGYCKRAQEDMLALTAADPDLRFVLKEFPILGPDSTKAHVVSMAFRSLMPEKYGDFHNQLLGGQGRASEATAMKIALALGADEAKLREEMKNPAINAAFEKTYELANMLAITGTPSYVVGSEVIFGALGQEVLAQKIAEARAASAPAAN
ncbi:MAG: DsbA family protein [Pseudomonadota bacterium]|nr:DsbA family protein [Pseudomonadota bacterium]MDQ2704293.1 DsbA family protein [Pseudomonadota bacterium]